MHCGIGTNTSQHIGTCSPYTPQGCWVEARKGTLGWILEANQRDIRSDLFLKIKAQKGDHRQSTGKERITKKLLKMSVPSHR